MSYSKRQKGFTLIEMLVVAPVVILAIGAFLTTIISMTGEVLASRASNTLTYNVQDALNRIEQDVKLSTTFLAKNNISFDASGAQSYNDTTTGDFTNINLPNGSRALILSMLVTNNNPLLQSAGIVYLADTPNACASTLVQDNTPMTMNVVYYVKNSALWRRVIMPSNYSTIGCSSPWQQPSCAPNYTATFCKSEDIKLVNDVDPATGFYIDYFTAANSTSANAAAVTSTDPVVRNSALQASPTVSVTISATQTVAGRPVERSATLRATRLDTNASSIATIAADVTPGVPVITSGTYSAPTTTTFKWNNIPDAISYGVQYRVNGGSWSATSSQTTNSFSYSSATHLDLVEIQVNATNSGGTSAFSSVAGVTIPRWATFNLQNSWTDYGSPWMQSGYTKTSSGTVVLNGLLKRVGTSTSGELIGTLPVGYRPSQNYVYQTIANNTVSRVDVMTNGNVVMNTTGKNDINLNGISFKPSGTTFTNITPYLNGWTLYADTNYGLTPSYNVDSTGRVELRGMISSGTITDGTAMFNLPVSTRPALYMHVPALVNGAVGTMGINSNGNVEAKNNGNVWFPIHVNYFPSTRASGSTCTTQWCAITPLQNSWVYYSAPYATPEYTKASDGMVSLKGLIRSGSTTVDNIIGNLPANYRPKGRIMFENQASGALGRVDIDSSGNIRYEIGSNTWYSLDGIMFLAEQ